MTIRRVLDFILHFSCILHNLCKEMQEKGQKSRFFKWFSGQTGTIWYCLSITWKPFAFTGTRVRIPHPPPKQKSIHASGCFFVLHKTILGDSNAVKKQHSALFLNGDRRFLQSIYFKILLLALQKSRATFPILLKTESILARECFFVLHKTILLLN